MKNINRIISLLIIGATVFLSACGNTSETLHLAGPKVKIAELEHYEKTIV